MKPTNEQIMRWSQSYADNTRPANMGDQEWRTRCMLDEIAQLRAALAATEPDTEQSAPCAADAYVYECRQPLTDPVIWCEFFGRDKPSPSAQVRNVRALSYTHPAPASQSADQVRDAAAALLAYLDKHDWGGIVEGATANRLRALLKASPAPAVTESAEPSDTAITNKAHGMYTAMVNSSGIHENRFPGWRELSADEQDGWKHQARQFLATSSTAKGASDD